jgi:hypothetical protein
MRDNARQRRSTATCVRVPPHCRSSRESGRCGSKACRAKRGESACAARPRRSVVGAAQRGARADTEVSHVHRRLPRARRVGHFVLDRRSSPHRGGLALLERARSPGRTPGPAIQLREELRRSRTPETIRCAERDAFCTTYRRSLTRSPAYSIARCAYRVYKAGALTAQSGAISFRRPFL